ALIDGVLDQLHAGADAGFRGLRARLGRSTISSQSIPPSTDRERPQRHDHDQHHHQQNRKECDTMLIAHALATHGYGPVSKSRADMPAARFLALNSNKM